jgi:arginyl-tRNA synthetase
LRKAQNNLKQNNKITKEQKKLKLDLLNHSAELKLIRQLIKFPEIVSEVAKEYSVWKLPYYSIDLATAFHNFYEKCRVISDDKNLTSARIKLIQVTKIVLKNTLDLMGISAPEKM